MIAFRAKLRSRLIGVRLARLKESHGKGDNQAHLFFIGLVFSDDFKQLEPQVWVCLRLRSCG
jgi:hypothetical protein